MANGGLRRFWTALGPGLVTGAADDDPSGIATYSQAGAQFGFALTWTMFLTLPFMAAIQIISAWIGWQTRQGLARNLARQLPAPLLLALVALLVVANTINIAADLAAMGEALRLVIGGPQVFYALVFGGICLRAGNRHSVSSLCGHPEVHSRWCCSSMWRRRSASTSRGARCVRATFVPQVSLDRDMILTVVAVFGTTISPYLFFWQASQEAEESRLSHRAPGTPARTTPKSGARFRHIAIDTWIGMIFSNLVAFFIIVTTAATLHAHGVTKIDTAAQAAEALRPIAGNLAFFLFAMGIIGTGLLAVPVLAGLGGLCGGRDVRAARQPRTAREPRARLLRHRRRGNARRRGADRDRHRSDRDAVLVRGDQRRRRRCRSWWR